MNEVCYLELKIIQVFSFIILYLRWKLLLYAPNPITMLNSLIFVKERVIKLKQNINVIEKEKSANDNCSIFFT